MRTTIYPTQGLIERSLAAMNDQEIFSLLVEQDSEVDYVPDMPYDEFIRLLREIVPQGKIALTSRQVVDVFNLRVQRENIAKKKPYTVSSIMLKVYNGKDKSMQEAMSEDTGALFPLTTEEETEIFGSVTGIHWFLLYDVLCCSLYKWRKQKKEKIAKGKDIVYAKDYGR